MRVRRIQKFPVIHSVVESKPKVDANGKTVDGVVTIITLCGRYLNPEDYCVVTGVVTCPQCLLQGREQDRLEERKDLGEEEPAR